jgi:Fe-S cluster biosynthesis and repair protein YggX
VIIPLMSLCLCCWTMSNPTERITQWENMCQEAPDDMSWFSLGNAYKDADRLEDAVKAYGESIAINEDMSKAYQLQGQVLIQLDNPEEAGAVLTKGYAIAAKRGDVMPQKAIGVLLEEKLGLALPEVDASQAPVADVDPDDPNTIVDRRSGRPGQRLPDPPMRGPIGQFIFDNYTQDTWREWIGQGTKVINELRLDFSRPDHQKTYEDHMLEWLGIDANDLPTE